MIDDLDRREWILTNGLGSFASGTITDIRTRTYHGWLFAQDTNQNLGRCLLLSHLEASLELPERTIALGANLWGTGEVEPKGYNFLRSFDITPVPTWTWDEQDWQLTRRLIMPSMAKAGTIYDLAPNRIPAFPSSPVSSEGNTRGNCKEKTSSQRILSTPPNFALGSIPPTSFPHSLLIHYRYEGISAAILRLRLLVADRDFHQQQLKTPELQFSQMLGEQQVCIQAITSGKFATPWHLRWTNGDYQPDTTWYWNYSLIEETKRGLGDKEDLYSPGYLSVLLLPGHTVTLEARVGFPQKNQDALESTTFDELVEAECWGIGNRELGMGSRKEEQEGEVSAIPYFNSRTIHTPTTDVLLPGQLVDTSLLLLKASDQFIVHRDDINNPTVIAGYPWFGDWGRDTLIALPGLTLATGRYELAKSILATFGQHSRYGLIPNSFPCHNDEVFYTGVDVALWWIESLGLYLEITHDWDFLISQYPIVQQIYKALIGGTRYNIQVDSTDGLVGWDSRGVALTWMDAVINGQPITPRRGKPVEVNALWYSALCWASRWAEILSEHGDINEQGRFAKQARRYTQQAKQVKVSLQKYWNSSNGYLYDTIDPDDRRNGQIRPNAVLAISFTHCGFTQQQARQILEVARSCLLTPYGLRSLDPNDPEYIGKYLGNQQQRDCAYHQGTVWCWLIGAFARSWQRFRNDEPLPFSWQPILEHLREEACIGSISEIFDGDEPHMPRGAIAQAKSVAEVIRCISPQVP